MVVVPDLFGKTLEEAKQELAKEKLVIIQSEVQLHEYLEDGKNHFPGHSSKFKGKDQ